MLGLSASKVTKIAEKIWREYILQVMINHFNTSSNHKSRPLIIQINNNNNNISLLLKLDYCLFVCLFVCVYISISISVTN